MKLKNLLIISSVTTCFLGVGFESKAFAEDIDGNIVNEEKKIDELNEKKTNTEMTLLELEKKTNRLTNESSELLAQKEQLEKEVNQLTTEIKELGVKITKRNEQIEEQARSTQINQTKQGLLDVLIESDSLSDAIGRTMAYTKLIATNNEIMQAQKTDQENLSEKKASLETKVSEITQKTTELKEKRTKLEASKKEQVTLAQDILENLEDSKEKKAEYVAQKELAQQVSNQKEQKAKEALEQEKKAKEIAANLQKQVDDNQLDAEGPKSLSKTTGEIGTADNSHANMQVTYASGFQQPLASFTVSSRFGVRTDPTGSSGTFHSGIDLAAPEGTPIMAARAGRVIQSGFESGAGNYVIIEHDNGYYTYYMHMVRSGISEGTNVTAGDIVGNVGTTGDSTGNHLHFGISTGIWSNYLDPAPFIGL